VADVFAVTADEAWAKDRDLIDDSVDDPWTDE
jgi:hypothetical protein